MEKFSVLEEEYSKYAGELGDCKTKEDRDSWLSGFGAFVLGWQARGERLLTPDAADGAKRPRCPVCGSTDHALTKDGYVFPTPPRR